MERGFKGVWIPKEIWLNESLSIQEKVFLVEIDSLDNNEDGCFASNEYFANFFKLSKNRCSEIIKSLEKKGFIKISYMYKENSKAIDKRVINILEKSNRGIRDSDRGTRKAEGGYSEKCEDNNTYLNNTFNNIYSLVIGKLNSLANKSYKSSSKKTQQLIRARVNEGFTVEDFYKVIENKVCSWKDDPKMDQYLRPATLFGTKFESYLNEKATKPIKGENYGKYREYEQHLDRKDKEIISNEETQRTAAELGIDL